MKFLLFILLVSFSLVGKAQKFALIDRDFKKPILFTDSVTVNQISQNYFPVNVSDLDSLFANLSYIKEQITGLQRAKFISYKLKSGATVVQVRTVPHAYGDSYDITLTTTANNVIAEYLLIDNKDLSKKAKRKLTAFENFVTRDKDIVLHHFKQFEPVILDATVYIRNK